jgi:hypothetical protein
MRKALKGRRPSPSMIVALIALFVALSGSAYAASKINGSSVKKGSLPGNRIKKNSVTGTQVKESSLGTVPKASHAASADSATTATTAASANAVSGVNFDSLVIGRSTVSGVTSSSCDPSTTALVDCGAVSLTLPRSGRILVVADAEYDGNNTGAGFRGLCQLQVDGAQFGRDVSPGSSDGLGVGFNSNDEGSTGLNAVTGVLAAGAHTLALDCNQQGGSIEYPATFVSAVGLSAG